MAEYNYGGTEEENAELRKIETELAEDPDSFDTWEKLVRAAEGLEGGINRNSNPQAITTVRSFYDRFLAKFPLLFGYWKKYADLEFSIAGTEAAEMVYERGVASISPSVDLWTNYCSFKVETNHDSDIIRELFERGASAVGLDFLAHPFWDKYIEFEERLEAIDKIFAILGRVIHIPMHQYARYFERYRQLAQTRPVPELAPPEIISQFRAEIEAASAHLPPGAKAEAEIERDLRLRLDTYHLEIFSRTQTETTKRWTYESEIKRPYFHVTELDEGQLSNWRKYLDFEEAEGSYPRIQFLYERCLVTCAHYDEFWLRYARWMSAQEGKEEEVRNIYQRASCFYVPIANPTTRLHYAYFEEKSDRVDVAKDIHHAILINLPGHIETIVSLANLSRRHGGLDAAIEVYKSQLDSSQCDLATKAALVAEWARLLWKIKGSPDDARKVFQKNEQYYLDSRAFWTSYLMFELEQPTSAEIENAQYERIKQVIDDIKLKSTLSADVVKELVQTYMVYLLERGTKDAAKEYMTLDREIHGPTSVQTAIKGRPTDKGPQNGSQVTPVPVPVPDPAVAVAAQGSPYAAYYGQTPVNGAVPTPVPRYP
ncbi:mRNA splicing protein [Paecilomyces variotii No. 5]|uniref:mRNA splicing protein n=1 Tax=Byssochlamys spectabilis (strain No. 5 / NBRC 109023) TaxID=1356009 RepID=V5GBD4_BYSSN|nr:mRNA splicing protein [Paecilomyces variotii No. 5]